MSRLNAPISPFGSSIVVRFVSERHAFANLVGFSPVQFHHQVGGLLSIQYYLLLGWSDLLQKWAKNLVNMESCFIYTHSKFSAITFLSSDTPGNPQLLCVFSRKFMCLTPSIINLFRISFRRILRGAVLQAVLCFICAVPDVCIWVKGYNLTSFLLF